MKRKERVVVIGTTSETTELVSGVAQGTVLGPLLFLLFVADVIENNNLGVKDNIDDTKVTRSI